MSQFLLLILAIVPGVVFFYAVEKKYRTRRPYQAALLGALSIIPILGVEYAVGLFSSAYSAFLVYIAIIEEGGKYGIARFLLKGKETAKAYESIIVATSVAIGFATIENIGYVINGGLQAAITRAVFTIPMHVCTGAIIGRYISARKPMNRLIKGLGAAIAIHAIFNVYFINQAKTINELLIPLIFAATAFIAIIMHIFANAKKMN